MWGGAAAYILGFALIIVGAGGFDAILHNSRSQPDFNAAMGFGVLALMLGGAGIIIAMVFGCLLHYRCWATMQGATTRTTPGKAVGFLFIPFYNLYWFFVSYHGLAKDINAYLDANPEVEAPRAASGLVLTTLIIYLCGIVPLLGYLCIVVSVPLFFLSVKSLKNSVAGIIDSHAAAPATAQ